MMSAGLSLALAGAGTGLGTLGGDEPQYCAYNGIPYLCQETAAEKATLRDATIGLLLSGTALTLASIPLFVFSKTKVAVK